MEFPRIEGYEVSRHQGDGTFGSVFRAGWEGKYDCAVKVLNLAAVHGRYLEWCMETLQGKEVPSGILPVYESQLDGPVPYVTSVWAANSNGEVVTLEKMAGKCSAADAWQCLRALAAALSWLHSHGIIHTGLTLGNVFLIGEKPENIAISDIGQGWIAKEQQADWRRHAPYLSPERCRHEPPQGEGSGEAWDVYAFGVLAYRLLSGKWPRAAGYFQALETSQAANAFDSHALAGILLGEPQVQWPARASSRSELPLRGIIQRCLALESANRYQNMQDVLQELEALPFSSEGAAASSASGAPAGATPAKVRESAGSASAAPASAAETAASSAGTAKKGVPKSPGKIPGGTPQDSGLAEYFRGAKTRKAGRSAPRIAEEEPPEVTERVMETRDKGPAAHVREKKWNSTTMALGGAAALLGALAIVFLTARNSAQSTLTDTKSRLQAAEESGRAARQEAAQNAKAAAEAASLQQADRENLRKTQEMVDRLLQTFLDHQPVAAGRSEEWQDALGAVAGYCQGFLEKHSKDPSLRESTARTRWHLANIRLAMGDKEAALQLLEESARDVDAVSAAAAGGAQAGEWTLLLGRIQNLRGQVSHDTGKSAEALQYLAQAGAEFEKWIAANPEDLIAIRELAAGASAEGRILRDKGDTEGATARLRRAAELLQALTVTSSSREEDFFALMDVGHEMFLAGAGRATDKPKLMAEVERYAVEYVAKLVKFDSEHPKSVPCRERLAKGWSEIGRVLMANDANKEASGAFNDAIKVLLELIIADPGNESYALQLGKDYGQVARLVSKARGPQESMEYARSAVNFLQKLVEKNRSQPAYRLQLGLEMLNLAETQELTSQFAEALKSAKTSTSLLDGFADDANAPAAQRLQALGGLAAAHACQGKSAEKLNDKKSAAAAYQKAIDFWQQFGASGGEQAAAEKGMAWNREQLQRVVKP